MKRFLILVLLTTLCLIFVSCNKSQSTPEGLEEFEQLLTDASSEETSAETEVPFAERVYVIIPQSCSAELSAKASEIAEKITDKTGVPVTVKYDNEDTLSQGNNLEILIGRTDRMRSDEVLEPLRVGEYLCCWDRGAIVIGGRYEESTLDAMNEFIEKVLPGSTFTSLMGADVKLEKTVEYELDRLTVNGYDLYDFTIAYNAENANFEKDIATFLKNYIAEQSGYLLDVISHTDRNEHTGKVIYVGDILDSEENWQEYNAKIKTLEGNDILVSGNGSYGISAAAVEFINKLCASENGNMDLTTPAVITANNASVKLCYAFVSGAQSIEQIYDFTEEIRDGGNDLIIFAPVSAQGAKYIKSNKCSYEFCSMEREDGSVFCVLYNSDVFEGIKCDGENQNVSFKSLKDGKRYCVSLYSDIQNDTVYGTSDAHDVLVVDIPKSEVTNNVTGFKVVGQTSGKRVYVEERFVLDEELDVKHTVMPDWENLFCSFEMRAPLCDEYLALKNTFK